MAGGELFGSSFSTTSFTRSVRTVLLFSDETGGLVGIVLLLFLIFNGVCFLGGRGRVEACFLGGRGRCFLGGRGRVEAHLDSDMYVYLWMIDFATSSVCGFLGN